MCRQCVISGTKEWGPRSQSSQRSCSLLKLIKNDCRLGWVCAENSTPNPTIRRDPVCCEWFNAIITSEREGYYLMQWWQSTCQKIRSTVRFKPLLAVIVSFVLPFIVVLILISFDWLWKTGEFLVKNKRDHLTKQKDTARSTHSLILLDNPSHAA